MRIPDFSPSLLWLNCSPLSFHRELKGKIVFLDFWTYCCINCIHVLPEIKALEKKYANEPVVFIGVHSPKFSNEKDSGNVCSAILRYDIEHPVVSDPEMTMWKALGVRSWPTFVLVSPTGEIVFTCSGEGKDKDLDREIARALEQFKLLLDHRPLAFKKEEKEESFLSFPGKVAYSDALNALIISDSNHHRLVVSSIDGQIKEIIGSGKVGLKDGNFQEACFYQPQGIAILGKQAIIADTENHALRLVDFENKQVTTLAGIGKQGNDRKGGNEGRVQEISSPWDVAVEGETVYIAMAGTHQIWTYNFKTKLCKVFSGSGLELLLDHTDPLQAAWAQPSGITKGFAHLYIADSESSSIRSIDLEDGSTETLAGGDPFIPENLFAYGDKEGVGGEARLQHPLGVFWHSQLKKIIVADTYNNRLKLLDPQTRKLSNWIGSGEKGFEDDHGKGTMFNEPSGLTSTADGKTLFVADTNNHAIRKIDALSLKASTMKFSND